MRWFLFELRTGAKILPFTPSSGRWEVRVGGPGTLEVTIPVRTEEAWRAELYLTAAPGRSGLACQFGSRVIEAGPVWGWSYDRPAGLLTLTARGIESLFDHRHVLPVIAQSLAVDRFFISNPANPGETMANPAARTFLSGLDLGSIARELVAQAMAWTGGSLPIDLQPVRGGVNEREYVGGELKNLGDALSDLRDVIGGPDVRFTPYLAGEQVRWQMETGTADAPMLAARDPHRFVMTATDPQTRNEVFDLDASSLASIAWATGGRTLGSPLLSRASHTGPGSLIDYGYPLLETKDTSHSNVTLQATLDAYARQSLWLGQVPQALWSFDSRIDGSPGLLDMREGDFASLVIDGDPVIPDGPYRTRMLGHGGEHGQDFMKVVCSPGVMVDA